MLARRAADALLVIRCTPPRHAVIRDAAVFADAVFQREDTFEITTPNTPRAVICCFIHAQERAVTDMHAMPMMSYELLHAAADAIFILFAMPPA
jgi:hypothetical protein